MRRFGGPKLTKVGVREGSRERCPACDWWCRTSREEKHRRSGCAAPAKLPIKGVLSNSQLENLEKTGTFREFFAKTVKNSPRLGSVRGPESAVRSVLGGAGPVEKKNSSEGRVPLKPNFPSKQYFKKLPAGRALCVKILLRYLQVFILVRRNNKRGVSEPPNR